MYNTLLKLQKKKTKKTIITLVQKIYSIHVNFFKNKNAVKNVQQSIIDQISTSQNPTSEPWSFNTVPKEKACFKRNRCILRHATTKSNSGNQCFFFWRGQTMRADSRVTIQINTGEIREPCSLEPTIQDLSSFDFNESSDAAPKILLSLGIYLQYKHRCTIANLCTQRDISTVC